MFESPTEFIQARQKMNMGVPIIRDLRIALLREFPNAALSVPSCLDIGCGVDNNNGRPHLEQNFTPAFCRDAVNAGWTVTGIDASCMKTTPLDWNFFVRDITTRGALLGLPAAPFDFVHTRLLISLRSSNDVSPGLVLPSGLRPYRLGLDLAVLKTEDYLSFVASIFSQVKAVLAPGGVFIVNDKDIFTKDGKTDDLVHLYGAPGRRLDLASGDFVELGA